MKRTTERDRETRRGYPPVNISPDTIIREDLPFPFVHYPGHYGIFFAFATREQATPTLCVCIKPAVINYVRLRREARKNSRYDDPLHGAPFSQHKFPSILARLSLHCPEDPLSTIAFQAGLCHRCNLTIPTLLYCHPMYGTRFIQRYGWYVNQAFLRTGIWASPAAGGMYYLPDVCPADLQTEIETAKQRKLESMAVYYLLSHGRVYPGFDKVAPAFLESALRGTQNQRLDNLCRLQRKAAQAERVVSKRIENMVRQEFGFRKVGEGWVSESILANIVSRMFPGEEILRHHRPEWLHGLELDIYLPARKLAFEYQGQQHFHAVAAWGGEDALRDLQERDARKASLCHELGIKLISIRYTEPLSRDHVCQRVMG